MSGGKKNTLEDVLSFIIAQPREKHKEDEVMSEWTNGITELDVKAYLYDNVDEVIAWLFHDSHGRLFVEDFLDFHYDEFEAFLDAHRGEATA